MGGVDKKGRNTGHKDTVHTQGLGDRKAQELGYDSLSCLAVAPGPQEPEVAEIHRRSQVLPNLQTLSLAPAARRCQAIMWLPSKVKSLQNGMGSEDRGRWSSAWTTAAGESDMRQSWEMDGQKEQQGQAETKGQEWV